MAARQLLGSRPPDRAATPPLARIEGWHGLRSVQSADLLETGFSALGHASRSRHRVWIRLWPALNWCQRTDNGGYGRCLLIRRKWQAAGSKHAKNRDEREAFFRCLFTGGAAPYTISATWRVSIDLYQRIGSMPLFAFALHCVNRGASCCLPLDLPPKGCAGTFWRGLAAFFLYGPA